VDLANLFPGSTPPPSIRDLTGFANNRWKIIRYAGSVPKTSGGRQHVWLLVCKCGNTMIGVASNIVSGISTSCGCQHSENLAARNTRHGLSSRPEYQIWKAIWQRCTNPKHVQWADYGGRGITVCQRWRGLKGFPRFLTDMGSRPKGYTIERRNNDKNYTPANCFWATRKEQNRNKRNNLMIKFQGETKCLSQWAEEKGIRQSVLYGRIVTQKWSTDKAFNTPIVSHPNRFLTFNGKTQQVSAWAAETGIGKTTLKFRLDNGWSVERTLTTPSRQGRRTVFPWSVP
jgi:hypothetical protein